MKRKAPQSVPEISQLKAELSRERYKYRYATVLRSTLNSLVVVAALNIANTINQVSNVVFLSLGNAVGILMGQMLGAGVSEQQIRRDNRRMIGLSVGVCFVIGGVMIALSGLFPRLYNTTEEVRAMAASLICISSAMMPAFSYNNAMYFTLRSGGQTFITFLFDSGFSWAISVPLAFVLSRFTDMPILWLYACCSALDALKIGVGAYFLRKGTWIRRLAD